MAHVSGPARRDAADRGQLILVTALSLAILFVALALILNTAIYTENLATRSSDIGGGTDAVRYHDAARDGVGGVVEYVTAHNNSSYATLRSELVDGVDAFSNRTGRLFVTGDRLVETTLGETENGTRIAQSQPDRNFTNESGVADWTVVEEVNQTRAFTINVTDATYLAGPGTGNEFQLRLSDGTDVWILNVTNDATPVGITNGTGAEFGCAGSATPVIDVTAGTVDGSPCAGLELAEGIDTPYNVSIDNGDAINGTYTMVVDNDTLAGSPGPHLVADEDPGQPFAAHAVYSANVTVVYETPRLFYEATVRVAPEEPDG